MMKLCAAAAVSLAALAAPWAFAGTAAQAAIAQTSEAQRATLFRAWLRASGEKCNAVTRTFLQGSGRDGAAYWNVQCSSGQAWLVAIKGDLNASTSYMDCKMLKAINAGTCFRKF